MDREGKQDSPKDGKGDSSSVCFEETRGSETEMDVSLDSVVSSQSTSSVCSALSTISSASRDSVQEGSSSSDRCINIGVIVMKVFCHILLKKKLLYSVFILTLLIITVAAAVEVAL